MQPVLGAGKHSRKQWQPKGEAYVRMKNNSTSATKPHEEICTDGGWEPNPGPGGYGVVLLHPKTKQRAETSGGFRLTTNNRMEIFAAIKGLEMLKQQIGRAHV